jgi:glucokinase
VVVGVDIGGTNVKIVLVDPLQQQLVESVQLKTLAYRGPERIVTDVAGRIVELKGRAEAEGGLQLAGVGVGCAGLIDLAEEAVLTSPNLPGWKNVQLGTVLKEKIQVPVLIENDVNCICYGEYLLGAGRSLNTFFCVAPGTGVGGGLIIDGKIWQGQGFSAGEVGHMTIEPEGDKCLCGNRGCLETLASGSWLVERAKRHLRQGVESSLTSVLESSAGLSAENIYQAAVSGDRLAQKLFEVVGRSLAIAIANVVHLLGVRNVLIAGGLAKGWDAFIGSLREELRHRLTLIPATEVQLVRARLGDKAGPLGAAYLVAERTGLM